MLRTTAFYWNLDNRLAMLYEILTGILRLLFLVLSCLLFAVLCAERFEGANTLAIAEQMKNGAPRFLSGVPIDIWWLLVPLQEWQYFRYLFAPITAFLFIFVSSVFYVRDIYHLPTLGRAFHYVTASLFGIFYPRVQIDGGRIDEEDPDDENDMEEKHLLRAIGGPGFAMIQPGNAVAFRDWRRVLGFQANRLYFMRPFEMIARVVNLEDQQGYIDEIAAVTRDGIRLHLKDINFRFCALRSANDVREAQEERNGIRDQAVRRSPDTPYPFSPAAVESIAYSFSVSDRGMDTWHETVNRTVMRTISGFITNHDLDYLTAPRQNGQDPRRELRVELFAPSVRSSLRRVGTELHWMDIGHFDIDDLEENKEQGPVDQTRTKFWATRWVGSARTIRAYGEAKHVMYQELARAEAQAEMIMSIADALRDVPFGTDRVETLRQIFLARTAQILDALQGRKNGKERS